MAKTATLIKRLHEVPRRDGGAVSDRFPTEGEKRYHCSACGCTRLVSPDGKPSVCSGIGCRSTTRDLDTELESRARSVERIAVDTLKCALSWEPSVRLIGNVLACDIARLAASQITACPACGAEPWVNIDCHLCNAISGLLARTGTGAL